MHKLRRNNVLNSPRLSELKNKKKKIFIRKIVIFSILFILLVGALSYISRIQRLNIDTIEITGNKVIETKAVMESISNQTSGKYLWLFPKTNILLYPKSKIHEELANKFKRFKEINISVENGRNLGVNVTERTPEYTWCGDKPTEDDAKEICYFLDKDGYIFDEAPYFSGEVYFKFYGKADVGTKFSEENFGQLILFKNALSGIKLKPVVVYMKEGEDLLVFLSREKLPQSGPEIRVKKNSDFQKMAENLKAVLETEPFLSEFKNKYSSLEYIDLRFGNKVYYKFK